MKGYFVCYRCHTPKQDKCRSPEDISDRPACLSCIAAYRSPLKPKVAPKPYARSRVIDYFAHIT